MAARMADRLRGALQSVGPPGASVSLREAVRAGVGSVLGLGLVGLVLATSGVDLRTGLFLIVLIAPFGASAVLMFAAPNSPLAQPWSAVVGNTVSAFAGVLVTLLVSPSELRVPLAVGVAVLAMVVCRAVHPPGGAVAMTAGLSPDVVHALGVRFALAPRRRGDDRAGRARGRIRTGHRTPVSVPSVRRRVVGHRADRTGRGRADRHPQPVQPVPQSRCRRSRTTHRGSRTPGCGPSRRPARRR
ncbi:HPP family protein [Gordonia amicalis]|nr:HPP family protein [Gordonia amicalis]UOG23004.1 HPP family protein [Gordonia amicalis]